MRKSIQILAVLLALPIFISAQKLMPYTLGATTTGSVSEMKSSVKSALTGAGFDIIGEYKPANDANRYLIIITNSDLKGAVKNAGGLTAFGAAMRVAITKEGSNINISYTTPEYWGNAYFQDKYASFSGIFTSISKKLSSALGALGTPGTGFGSKKGLSASALQKYHYMMGMPYFKDNVILHEFGSFAEATSKIESNLVSKSNIKQIYSIKIPGKNIKVYGVGLSGSDGESSFLPIIDKSTPKHTAFLPYEMLVIDGKVYMLHGRYRIALAFPDLSMGTFMKIVSTPGNIEEMLKSATE